MALHEELSRAATLAAEFAAPEEQVEAVLAAEPSSGGRVYVCAYADADGARTWLVLEEEAPVTSLTRVREVVSLTALCEVVGEAIGDDPPRLASPAYHDERGAPDLVADAFGAVESLTHEVEAGYKRELA